MSVDAKREKTVEEIANDPAINLILKSSLNLADYSFNSTGQLVDKYIDLKNKLDEKEKSEEKEIGEIEIAYVDFIKWAFEFDKRATKHKLVSAWITTILVPLITIAGITFSGFQLYQAIKINSLKNLNTNLQFEAAGAVSINSSVVGGIILVISIVFFYLYLRFAYEKPVINIYKQDINPPEKKP